MGSGLRRVANEMRSLAKGLMDSMGGILGAAPQENISPVPDIVCHKL